jgi:hypothetical protein
MRRGLIRLTCGVYCLLTAAYAFTSASAFTYQELIRPRMFGVGVFSQWHHLVYWPWLALILADLRAAFRHPSTSVWAWSFAGIWAAAGRRHHDPSAAPELSDSRLSLIVGAVALLPLVWAAALDHGVARAYLRRQPSSVDAPARCPRRPVVDGVFRGGRGGDDRLCRARSVDHAWRLRARPADVGARRRAAVERDRSRADLRRRVSGGGSVCPLVAGRAFIVQYLAVAVVLITAIVLIVQRTVCDALGLDGWGSALVAVSSAAAIVSTWGALRLRAVERPRRAPPVAS